jgi:hypothetical protein
MTTSTTRAQPTDAGCWIDGHWGGYGVARMIEIAAAHGFVDHAAEPPFATLDCVSIAQRHLAAMGPSTEEAPSWEEIENMEQASDDVESWLNSHVAPEGYSFGWHDGEFFLWSDETWAEESY